MRIHAVAKELRTFQERRGAIWNELDNTLQTEYLAGVNEQVTERFLNAVRSGDDPEHYHQRFRTMAGLLIGPSEVISTFASAPVRKLG